MSLIRQSARQEQFHHYLQRPVCDLAAALAIETRKFLAGQPHDSLVGMALFTLAIVHKNQEAWACLYSQYKPLVLSWIMQRPEAAQLIARDGDASSLINSVFTKFFQAVTPAKLQDFQSLSALLKYLQLCSRSVIYDEARLLRALSCENAIEEVEQELAEEDLTSGILTTIDAEHLWRIILEELHNDDERLLMYQIYQLGMKPGEICWHTPHLFPTADDVYRVKRNVLERLRRSKRLRNAAYVL